MINIYHFKAILMAISPPSTALMKLLSEPVRARLIAIGQVTRYTNGQLIHARGEDKPGLSIVQSGAAQVGINSTDGIFIPVALLGEGETFGEFTIFTQLPRTHDISAVGETQIIQITHQKFSRLNSQEPEIGTALLQISLLRNHQLLEMLDALRRLPILERTASMLLSMSATSGTPTLLQVKQDELAFALGISRVSLGKALRRLADLSLITLGYRQIEFRERTKLEQWVNEQCDTTPLYWRSGTA